MLAADGIPNCSQCRVYMRGGFRSKVAIDVLKTPSVSSHNGGDHSDIANELIPKVWVWRDVKGTKRSGNPGQIH
jgi:hypothetical protein